MMLSLHIENIAVAQKVDIDLKSGFSILTGETGAGKSIIVDSLNLLLGARPSKDIIRKGESHAMVSALFGEFDDNTARQIEDFGINIDTDGAVLTQRNISIDGRAVSKINGRSVSTSVLREITGLLLNIHGQHDAQNLLQPEKHILFLDNFADIHAELEEYSKFYEKVNKIKNNISELSQDERDKQRTIDLLKYQINEIEKAELKTDEEEVLEDQKRYIQNSEKIIKSIKTVQTSLVNSEKSVSAADQMKRAVSAIKNIGDFVPKSDEYIEKLEDYIAEVTEIAAIIDGYMDDDSEDPVKKIDKIESRLDQIDRLKLKYGISIKEILAYKEKIVADLDNIIFADEKIAALKTELDEQMIYLEAASEVLTKKRVEAAKILEKKIMDELQFLEMEKVSFNVEIDRFKKTVENNGGVRYASRGVDNIEFLIATNPGEPPKPLARIASGGELSRIMLAMKSVFAKKDSVDTIIFDEIDTGISGRTAEKVGIKLKSIARDIQVICVTHSAQIASLADSHYLIEKHEVSGRAVTEITELDKDQRIKEIARIMGGITITELIMDTATEMINKNSSDTKEKRSN